MDKELQSLLFQQWSNGACRGYVIWAMENCGFQPDDIQRVVSELHYVFDMKSIEECQIMWKLIVSMITRLKLANGLLPI